MIRYYDNYGSAVAKEVADRQSKEVSNDDTESRHALIAWTGIVVWFTTVTCLAFMYA